MKMKAYICLLAAAAMMSLCLSGCGQKNDDPAKDPASDTTSGTVSEESTLPPAPISVALSLVEFDKSEYAVVRAEDSSEAIKQASIALHAKIKEKTGVTMKLATDWYSPREENPVLDAPEILVGMTNRPESAEVLASLPANSYTVTIKNNKLVILGTDNNLTALALYAFEENILNNTEKCREGYLHVDEVNCISVTLPDAFTLSDMIAGEYDITCSSKKVVQTTTYDQYRIGQGSCSDGTYAYFVLRNSGDTGSVVVKHRLDDGSFVAVSEPMKLGHGNDMTFDTKNNRLVIAHGQSEGQILTLVNPDTLTLIKDIGIPKGSGAITYSVAKDRYAISQGGSTLHILDGDFKWIVSYSRTDKSGYTAQGMGSDEDYIYFPMSGSKDNVLVVYNWGGQYVTTIQVPVDHESESMFWVNDKYYIAYNSSGEMLHETTFEIVYQSSHAEGAS